MFKPNTLFYSDGYKTSHKRMLAPNTTYLYGTWIPRSLKHIHPDIKKVVSMGQQLTMRWLDDEFNENFFYTNKRNIVEGKQEEKAHKTALKAIAMKFGEDMGLYLGIPYDSTHFGELWDLGYLPIKVKALPEGLNKN